VVPFSSEWSEAFSTTGPSATGSEKGTPISITSAPPASRAASSAKNRSLSGKPAGRKGISAFLPALSASMIRVVNMDWLMTPPPGVFRRLR